MNLIAAYLYPMLISLLLGYYNGWQWTDEQDGVYDPKKAKPHWKTARVLIFGCAIIFPYIFIEYGIKFNKFDYLISICLSAPAFDISTNMVRKISGNVKDLKWWYLGTTSKSDRIGYVKWIIYGVFIVASIILKIKIS
jgi:hypothetical protein